MTEFENRVIPLSAVPLSKGMAYEALTVQYKNILLLSGLFLSLIPYVPISVINLMSGETFLFSQWWFYAAYLLPALLVLVFVPISVSRKGYVLRDHDIHYKSGVIWQRTISLPFNRIQHVEVESGPLERLYDLGTVKLYTAGGGRTDMAIPGLKASEASSLRDLILSRASEARKGTLTGGNAGDKKANEDD